MIDEATISFIKDWQTLIGSFSGPFLAIILSALAFVVREKWQKIKERKEAIRRVEISLSYTLNDIFSLTEAFKGFFERVDSIIHELKEIPVQKVALIETNFPPIVDIHIDAELSKMKFRSYYLHNKILIIEYSTKWANNAIKQFREDFDKLIKKNEFLIINKVSPEIQKKAYFDNLTGFISMVKKSIDSLNEKGVPAIAKAKVYNLKLMKKYRRTLWKFERTKQDMINQSSSLDCVDRIDKLMEAEAAKLLGEVEKRKENMHIS